MKRHRSMEPEDDEIKPIPHRKRNAAIIGGAVFVLILVVVVILSVLLTRDSDKQKPDGEKLTNKIDCLPENTYFKTDNDKALCDKQKYCLFDPVSSPHCYYDSSKMKYELISQSNTDMGVRYIIRSNFDDKVTLVVDFEYLTFEVLRFKITVQGKNAYEVPIDVKKVTTQALDRRYEVQISSNSTDFYFKIIRKSTQTVIWDTTLGGLIVQERFLQITTKLPSKNVYGFGENKHTSYKHDLQYRSWPIFARDQALEWTAESNLYGTQPFYTCMENDGQSHGVALLNSNAMEYEFIPEPGLIYRTTGGIFDFYVFLGPDPESVVQQFTDFFGRTFMPPYWALGFQISRYGYKDLNDMKEVLQRFDKYQIPLDTQVADIDHMDERKIFTIDSVNWKGLNDYFKQLEARGMKTILILDPFLVSNYSDYQPFFRGLDKNVYITWPKGKGNNSYSYGDTDIMLGYCWPKGKVVYPDFFKTAAKKWWVDEIVKFRNESLKFHGLWIDMNEPAVFGTNLDKPFNWPDKDKPYWALQCPDDEEEKVKTKASFMHAGNEKKRLSDKTLCMSARQGDNGEYSHYNVHNLYGLSETIPTYEAAQKATNTRGLVITRSTFFGSGKYAGHWTGDNESKWSHLYYSIIGMFEFNQFGIPYVGADICGFFEDATEELCQRWSQLGAFYPFSRNHNGFGFRNQDPGSYSEAMAQSTKKALEIRYEILPYYYTLFYKAHLKGNTVIRPLFHEYPRDNKTYSIDKQFLVGPGFMVSPVLEEKTVKVTSYFPDDRWFNYYDGALVKQKDNSPVSGRWHEIDAPLDIIPLHIRGGYIIPTQKAARTTVDSRKNPFGLIIAMNEDGEAKGDLFDDDGESIKILENYFYATFSVRANRLNMRIEHNNYGAMASKRLNKIRIFSTAKDLFFTLNGNALAASVSISYKADEIVIEGLDWSMNK